MDHHHHNMSYYNRVSSGRGGFSSSSSSSSSSTSSCHGKCRGFRLNLRRVYYLRLRKRFNFFLRIFDRLTKLSYSQALKILKKVFQRRRSGGGFKRNNSNSSRDGLVVVKGHVAASYVRNNSFYAEAIADCLEFIKRTSVSSSMEEDDQIHQDKIS
ncbi:hypothetical protein PIB30_055876 [Stylosanthes scabra]|uniref:Uncharacterized protein n=1 Tax=Stylosanthes scabra TaxID=79078 RepID=A0ABU6WL68_9FABA|nr:hypothetical protein [Stylosanthes scabra]